MIRKRIRVFMMLALASVMLCGCGQKNAQEKYVVVNPNKKDKIKEEENKNKLKVWCWDPAFNINAMEKAEEIYKQDHSDFELEIIETPWADVQTKLTTAVGSATTDTLPDIVLVQDGAFQKNVISYPDGFVDLTNTGIKFDEFSAGKVGFSTVDGKNYGVPFDNGAVISCYRSDILEKAGYSVSDFEDITWDEYIEKGKKVLKKTGKPLLSCVAGESDVIVMMLQSAGGSFFTEDGKLQITNNKILKEVIQTYVKMVEEGVLLEVNDWDKYVGSINDGKVAGTINGCWIMASIQEAEDQAGKWEVTNMPRLTKAASATNYANQGGSSWAVTTGCQNIDLAVDFLGSTFGGSVEFYENILNSGAISCYLPAGESPMYSEESDYFSGEAVNSKVLEYAGNIPACVTGVYFYEARDAAAIAISNVLDGADLQSELKKAEQKVKSAMDQ